MRPSQGLSNPAPYLVAASAMIAVIRVLKSTLENPFGCVYVYVVATPRGATTNAGVAASLR